MILHLDWGLEWKELEKDCQVGLSGVFTVDVGCPYEGGETYIAVGKRLTERLLPRGLGVVGPIDS
jgi:hypothetical protein